ncbi:MAG TPA: sugar ABC transporter ATP-binding protein [Candidatus Hydrogenedentes bacterium]|nr:sugar ABC transporter ATP-binding protein [Candidatus Hydrogenedentota bacterium]HOH50350.1 sugar ABC transporter ATP-binding protein [Candidatus Hydrogenedentota bacterium]
MADLLLEMRGITKQFPGVLALDDVSLDLREGEVHCLLGENGAGKSTLMKILAGAQPADAGDILIGGRPAAVTSPARARELGVSMIYQEFNLSPFLSVAENIFLGREPRIGKTPFIDGARLRRDAEEVLRHMGVTLDVRLPVNRLSVAQMQMVEIAKAVSVNARILVMDEPSATLTDHELASLFTLIGELRGRGMGILYISHRLEEVFQIGDRATVMRDGRHVATRDVADLTREDIIRMMVGRELTEEFPKVSLPRGAERLRVEGLTREGLFHDVGFSLHAGEIVGLTGLVGSRRTEVVRAIFGADRLSAGRVFVDGREVAVSSPRDAIAHGVGLLTEDRKNQGLVLGMSVRENITLANLGELVRGIFVKGGEERRVAEDFVRELQIKTPSVEQAVQLLSGGTQQKVVLARWLFTNAGILMFDEPTRGVDVGAKTEIFRLMNALLERGAAVLMVSSELPEVLGMCDRILVMHEGRLAGELSRAEATQERIMQLATGGGRRHG